jgi:hypothetical protein
LLRVRVGVCCTWKGEEVMHWCVCCTCARLRRRGLHEQQGGLKMVQHSHAKTKQT